MIYIGNLDIQEYFSEIDVEIRRTRKGGSYINIEAALDIETTSIKQGDEKHAFMYIWMFGIGLGNPVIYGRTWEELDTLFSILKETFYLCDEIILPVYVHNLGYEFQFMRKYFDWSDVFAVGERKPIKANIVGGIELRDSYILSGYSLANTAKNLTKYKVKKLVGELDYSLVRTWKTPLTESEMAYCENDVLVVLAYIKEQIEQYGDITKIPMTNTGRVRRYVKEMCYQTSTSHKKSSKGKYIRYRKIMEDLTVDVDIYAQLKRAFMGGFTHASNAYSGEILEGVSSIDLTSSYPTVMISELFPMSRAKPLLVSSVSELKELAKSYCLVFDVKFTGIINKIGNESYISESRCCTIKGATIDNGRVFSADELTTTITDVDLEIISGVYSWEEISISNLNGFVKGRLPKPIIKSILKLYVDKTELKGIEGKETEYLLSKGMLNSVYGMSVTDILQDSHEYRDEWFQAPVDIAEKIDEYNKSKNRFLYYPWGVWVTAYARRNVWTAIMNIGKDYVYCDTDSVKMLNFEAHQKYIQTYNDWVMARLVKAVDEVKLDRALLVPTNNKGEPKPLGIWEHEGTYDKFKTLGAKRYMYLENGEFSLVVAGLSKRNGMDYMKRKCNGEPERIFRMFDDSLYIPSEETGKMTHTYIDSESEIDVIDHCGEHARIVSKRGIHLEPCEFTLSVSSHYLRFIQNMKAGYFYKGEKLK